MEKCIKRYLHFHNGPLVVFKRHVAKLAEDVRSSPPERLDGLHKDEEILPLFNNQVEGAQIRHHRNTLPRVKWQRLKASLRAT